MKKNYKLQNTNYKQITNYKLQITNIRGGLQTYFKLSIVNYQLSMKPAPNTPFPQSPITPSLQLSSLAPEVSK